MDLIYATDKKEDVGVMQNYTFDLAYGIDENNFELTTNINNHVCKTGYILYIENTEYGGVIDKIRVATESETLVYKGRSWHGILESKVIEPNQDEDYLICDGEANSVLASLINRIGLSDLFKAHDIDSGIYIHSYKMNRYIKGYSGIRKMLKSANAKLKVNFQNGFVILSAENLIDYSQDDEFDSSQISFDIEKNYKPINHMICLGKGDLALRKVIHLYTDTSGNISHIQTQFGMDEVTDIYENVNAESDEELESGGIENLLESWNADSLQVNFDSTRIYDVGDIVGARENTTGIFVSRPIEKKIITIKDGIIIISHKVGE